MFVKQNTFLQAGLSCLVTWTQGGRTFPGTSRRYRRGRTRPPLRTPWRFSSVAASCWVFLLPAQASAERKKPKQNTRTKGEDEQDPKWKTDNEWTMSPSRSCQEKKDRLPDRSYKRCRDLLMDSCPEYLISIQFKLIFQGGVYLWNWSPPRQRPQSRVNKLRLER